jgi:hypothetical protein
MQKELRTLLMVACFVMAATLVFVACGSGDIIEIANLAKDLDQSDNIMIDKVNSKDTAIWPDGYVPPLPPISSEAELPPPSSSIDTPLPLSSSVYVPPPPPPVSSSSYQLVLPSSSSINVPKSSSSTPVQTGGGCRESNPKTGVTCGWNVTGTLTPGTMLKPAAFTLPSGCSSVSWKYAPDTAAMALNYECETLGESGFAALGSRNYVLFAILTCDDGSHTNACNPKTGLSSKIAPILEGECKWDKNPPEVTAARGATPSGVTVKDADHVCSSPTVVYKYDDGSKTWPSTGILSEWKNWGKNDTETYNVEATLNCPAYPQVVTSPCPPLKVSGGVEHIIECTCASSGQCQVAKEICKTDGASGKNTVILQKDECVEINVYGYNNQYVLTDVGVRCDSQVSSTVTYAGKSKTFQYNSDLLVLGKLKIGDNEFGTVCVTSGGPVTCSGPGN